MAQLNDLIVLGNTSLIGPIKANSDHDLLAHANEFNFASPKFSGDIYINYRTASGSDGVIGSYRFCKGAGNALSNIYASTFYGALSGNATSASAVKVATISSNGTYYLLSATGVTGNLEGKAITDTYYYYNASEKYSSLNIGKTTKNGILTLWKNSFNTDIKSSATEPRTITLPNQTGTVALKDATNTFSAANTFSGNNTFSGTNTFSGRVILSRTTDAQGDENNEPALRIGDISGTHLEFDGNEIMAKNSGTAIGPLYLNNNGGLVTIGSGGLKVSGNIEGTGTLTMTGAIKRSAFPTTWVAACKGDALINSTYTAGSFSPMMSGGTTNGRMAVAIYQGGLRVGYITKANCDANTNTLAADVTLANESGGGVWPGTISAANVNPKTAGSGSVGTSSSKWSTMYATTFYGALSGNASTASKLTDIASGDIASNTATQRYVFISYNDLTTGRPAYDTRFTFQTSTGILTAPIFAGSGANLTSLNASKISSGTLSVARGGTGRNAYATTDYTGNQYRASKIQNTVPTSIDNGCIVYVYSDTTTL